MQYDSYEYINHLYTITDNLYFNKPLGHLEPFWGLSIAEGPYTKTWCEIHGPTTLYFEPQSPAPVDWMLQLTSAMHQAPPVSMVA
jgi:hypothetical protein